MTFYDSHGKATAYLHDDGIHIYLFNGRPVAYLYDDAVYGFNGHQFGWFEDGWIRDLNGCCVFFTENATGSGPVKPVKCVKELNMRSQLNVPSMPNRPRLRNHYLGPDYLEISFLNNR